MRRLVGIAAATVLLAGCAVQPLDPDTGAVIPPQNAGMQALLVGALRITDECVTLETPDEGVVLPIFPTSRVGWDDDILMFDGEPYADGAPIWLDGGSVQQVPSGAHVPDGCPTEAVFLVGG